MKLMKLRSKKFFRSLSGGSKKAENLPAAAGSLSPTTSSTSSGGSGEIKWELRPGGMLVQRRDSAADDGSGSTSDGSTSTGDDVITLKVSTVSNCHPISIQSTSTFGELKMILSMVTNLEPKEQRLLYRGKEREDNEYLHMAGVKENDKVLVLEDPAVKERKLRLATAARGGTAAAAAIPYRTVTV